MNLDEIYTIDQITGERISLTNILLEFDQRLENLEEEGIGTANSILELWNDLDMVKLKDS